MMIRVLNLIATLFLCGVASGKLIHVTGDGRYELSFWGAYEACHNLGAALASPEELQQAQQEGYSKCSCGWLSDHTARYPITSVDSEACGVGAGIQTCDWQDRYNAYCMTYDPLENCTRPLGIETGKLRDDQFATTSVNHAWWGPAWSPHKATLNRGGLVNAWMPDYDGRNQYLEITFDENMALTGIMTQGAKRYTKWQYVSEYKIKFSRDGGLTFRDYLDGKVFTGNYDNDGHVRNWFEPPILTKVVRIYPHSWYGHITLRVEFFGCTLEEHDLSEDSGKEEDYESPPDVYGDDYY